MSRSTRVLTATFLTLAVLWVSPAPAAASPRGVTMLTDAISSWWARPNATYQPLHGITYMTGVSSSGDWVWGAYDHKSGVMTRKVLGTFRADDHNTPAILAPTDRPPAVFYTGHNKKDVIWYRVSRQIGDWLPGPERSLKMPGSVTYVQVHRGRTPDTLLLLTRCGDRWLIAVSSNYGASWTIRPLIQFDPGAYGYLITTQLADGSIRIAAAGHPERTNLSAVYYGEIDARGDVRTVDSAPIANIYTGAGLPIRAPRDMPVIHRFAEGDRARLFDVSTAPDAEVMIAEWSGDDEAHYVHLQRHDSEWTATDLVPTGRPFGYTFATRYVGGATFPNPTQGGDVYLSREAKGRWRVERWRRGGDDAGWAAELIASDFWILARPSAPIGASPQLPLLWLRMTRYSDYRDFNGSTQGLLKTPRPVPAADGTPIAGDWDGDGKAGPGAFDAGVWKLRIGGRVTTVRFGRAGDRPIVGDWDGDGKDGIGVRRGARWLLCDDISSQSVSADFSFGRATDTALAGDWDGDGADGVAIRRGATWYLKDELRAGVADSQFLYGSPGDAPVVGDWDADGRDGIGIRRADTWLLRKTADAGPSQISFRFGRSSDTAVAADWGGLGMDSPGVRRGDTGVWFVVDTAPGVPRADYAPSRFRF